MPALAQTPTDPGAFDPTSFDPTDGVIAGDAATGGKVDPNTVLGATKAASSTPEAVSNVMAIAHSGNMLQVYDLYSGLNPSEQALAWQGLNTHEQAALTQFGAKEPDLSSLSHTGAGGQHGGLWGDLAGWAHDAAHDVNVGGVPGKVLGGAVHGIDTGLHQVGIQPGQIASGLNKGLQQVQHLERAANYEDDKMAMQEFPGSNPSSQSFFSLNTLKLLTSGAEWKNAVDPGAWAQGWQKTADGNKSIFPSAQRQLDSEYGPDKVNLALRAQGDGGQSIINNTPVANGARAKMVQQIQDPSFQELMTKVGNAHMTFGQAAVGTKVLNDNPGLAHTVSGALDAVFDIAGDPTLGAGRAAEGTTLARWGVKQSDIDAWLAGDSSKMDRIVNSKGFDKLAQQVGPYLEKGEYGTLGRLDPRFDSIAKDLKDANVTDAQGFKDWMTSKAGLDALMDGRVAKPSHGVVLFPHLSYFGWAKAGVKDALQTGLDKLGDGPLADIPVSAADGEVTGMGDAIHADTYGPPAIKNLTDAANTGKLLGKEGDIPLLSGTARLIKKATTLIAQKPYIATGPLADVATFRQFVDGFLSRHDADLASNLFLHADEGQQRSMVMALTRQWFHAAGMFNTPKMQEESEKFLSGMEETARHQTYAPNDYDKITGENGLEHNSAVVEGQLSHAVAIPNPNTLRRIARENGKLEALGIPVKMLSAPETFMHYWRASVLNRPGFAVRFALDEETGRLMRSSVKQVFASHLAQGAAFTRSDADIEAEVQAALKRGEGLRRRRSFSAADFREPTPAETARAARRATTPEEETLPAIHRSPDSMVGSSTDEAEAMRASLRAAAFKPLLPFHPIYNTLTKLATVVPEGIRPFIDTPNKMYGAITGSLAYKFRQVERGAVNAMGLGHYIDAATHLFTHQPVQEAFDELMSAVHGDSSYFASPMGHVLMLKEGVQGVNAALRAKGSYSKAAAGEEMYMGRWMVGLDQYANSKLGQAVLQTIHNSHAVQERAVANLLRDPSLEGEWKQFERWDKTSGGKVVGVDATREEAIKDFSRSVRKSVNAMVRTGNPQTGDVLDDVVNEMLETGRGPSIDTLMNVPGTHRPENIYGPDLVPVGKFENFLSKPFELMVGRPANWLTRQPHFIQLYGEALKELRSGAEEKAGVTQGLKDGIAPDELAEKQANAEKLLSDQAMRRAFNTASGLIHNPRLRTQFEDMHRILFPFLFAQRQFLQRWGRTIVDSPDTIRKIQLTHNGLLTAGVIHRDPSTGEEYFYYPGTQYVLDMLTSSLGLFNIHMSIPMQVPFTGQVLQLAPGLSNPTTPSTGPFLAVAMKELGKIQEPLQARIAGVNQAVLGAGAGTPTWQQATPSIFNRLWNALGPEQNGSELASTTMQAAKYLDATGHGLPKNATGPQIEAYQVRLTNWARSLLVIRAWLGFVLPATPNADLDGLHLDKRLEALLGELPYDQAITQYIKEHPDATAYTVSESQNPTDGATPATDATLKYAQDNEGFVRDFPLAAAWFMPRTGSGFNPAAYREQIALGQRNPKSFPQFLDGVVMAKSSGTYYTYLDAYEKEYDALQGNVSARQNLVNWWTKWSADFKAQNPTFRDYLISGAGHQHRLDTIDDVKDALNASNLPANPMNGQMKLLVDAYDEFNTAYQDVAGRYTKQATDTKNNLKTGLDSWGANYIRQNPEVADFWNTVIRPEIDDTK